MDNTEKNKLTPIEKTKTKPIENNEITPKKKLIGNIAAGAVTVACGLFLLLCGINAINLQFREIFLASLLFSVGIVFLVTGFIQKNSVSIWISFAFLTPAVIEVLAKYSSAGYSNLYPLYIAIPAIASIFTALLTRNIRSHIGVVAFFGIISALFMLNSFGSVRWGIVVPCMVVFIGFTIIYMAVMLFNKGEEKGDDDK